MDEIQAYILRFLLGDSVPEDACRAVGYTADAQAFLPTPSSPCRSKHLNGRVSPTNKIHAHFVAS